jgi:glycosyltransferase involved in cell wall biosynthesis
MKILLVGNYLPDRQHSMQRFANMLDEGLRARGHEVRLLRPEVKVGRGVLTAPSSADVQPRRAEDSAPYLAISKWLAYIDKFLLFPLALRRAVNWADVVQISDHSNAMYAAHLRGKPHVVTCHDLLAVRGAFGENTDCPATATGKILQRWILRSLRRSQKIACVSSATRADLCRLAGDKMGARSCVVPLGVPSTMGPGTSSNVQLADLGLRPTRRFLLNVGSNLSRKNRDGALRIFKRVSEHLDCDLVFAGEALSPELQQLKSEIGLNGNVIEVPQPSDATLEALYRHAFALLYPTKFEGFGWPAIEAQACGCPVVSSQSTSIPEVMGDSAFLRMPDDEEGFATDILRLTDSTAREQLVQRGFENVKRFTPERMVNDYIQLYEEVCARS